MRLLFGVVILLLSGCMSEAQGQSDPQDAADPFLDPPRSQSACEAVGGRWARGGLFPEPLCFLPTPDAGQSCAKAGDCVGVCFADTRQCAPETPIFGCYNFLDESGREMTICAD